jgi:hypothetical protein
MKKKSGNREYGCVVVTVVRKAPAGLENRIGTDEQINPENRC